MNIALTILFYRNSCNPYISPLYHKRKFAGVFNKKIVAVKTKIFFINITGKLFIKTF